MVLSGAVARRPAGRDDRAAAAPVLRRLPVPPRVQVAAAARRTRCSSRSSRRRSRARLGDRRRRQAEAGSRRRPRQQTIDRSNSSALRRRCGAGRSVCDRVCAIRVPQRLLSACRFATYQVLQARSRCPNVHRDKTAPEAVAAAGDDTPAAAGDQAPAAVADGAVRHGPRRDAREPDPRGRGRVGQRAGEGGETPAEADSNGADVERVGETETPDRRDPRRQGRHAPPRSRPTPARTRRSTSSTGRTTSTTRRRPRRCRRTVATTRTCRRSRRR